MACRKIMTQKHIVAARLLVDGWSGYRALLHVGYSHYSSRNFGLVLRHSWGLREAVRREEERRSEYLVPRPARRRRDRYARRAVAAAVRTYCVPEFQAATNNAAIRDYEKSACIARRIAAGLPSKSEEPKKMVRCPSCGAVVDERKMFLNFSQTASVCSRCAGVG
jgi:hypothetical protein